MKYHVIGHDFTVGVDNTPSVLTFDEYSKNRNGCGDWEMDSYDTLEEAMENLITHFELEKWIDDDTEADSYQVYGYYCTVETDLRCQVLATSEKIALHGYTIDEWKADVEECIDKGVENKYFYFDDPHYTYCPKGW